jgi:hypothetical protein
VRPILLNSLGVVQGGCTGDIREMQYPENVAVQLLRIEVSLSIVQDLSNQKEIIFVWLFNSTTGEKRIIITSNCKYHYVQMQYKAAAKFSRSTNVPIHCPICPISMSETKQSGSTMLFFTL